MRSLVSQQSECLSGITFKKNAGKVQLSLISRAALEELAKVLEFGAKKYSRHGWREVADKAKWSELVDAALRHLLAFNEGETLDSESGLLHVAHAMCNCM